MGNEPPDDVDDEKWIETCRRADIIRNYLQEKSRGNSSLTMAKLAIELALSRATTYRLVKLFREGGTVRSLLNRAPGRPVGMRFLDDQRQEIIHKTIHSMYLKPTRPPFVRLVREIQAHCISAGLKPVNWRTVKARLEDIELHKRAKQRGESKIIKMTTATPGEFRASRPLEIVQIDHTRADVFVVDEKTRAAIGRPWLTLALDIYTRMVTGFHLTMESPSRLSTSLCLLHSVFDKTAWLKERGIVEAWPVAGLPETLHTDNGTDFRSRAFERGCQDAGMRIEWRPPAQPHYGGHIERLIGSQMGALHLLPGSTFSNTDERGQYDAKCHSALTLRELEQYIALEIVGSYHHTIHRSLGRPPISVWREHEDQIPLRLPQDRMQFWLTFLPEEERTLRPDGIHLFGLRYWSSVLTADLGRTKGRLLIKYDPRDMSRIFVRRPSGNFIEARYADLTLPSITLHEANSARRTLLELGRRQINTQTLVRTVIAQRELIDAATRKANAARQKNSRNSKLTPENHGSGTLRGVDSSKPVPFVEDTD
jgi:putative transposase